MNFFKKIDFLGIGDTTTDAFIELEDAWVEQDGPAHKKELCMKFGDKLPYKDVVIVPGTGNSANACHAAMKLGLNAALVSNIGNDDYGSEILKALKKNNIETKFVKVHKNKKSNYNFVLRFKEERTILVHHNEYDYSLPKISSAPRWIYLSSLSQNSKIFHVEIAKYVKDHPETKLAFQPGTFQVKLGYSELKDLYEVTEIFFCNKEEAQKILNTAETDIKKLLNEVFNLGPKNVVITDGPNGAYTFDGKEFLNCPIYPDPKPPVDRTGAGDSFSSTFVSAIIMGKSIREALSWGPVNSMNVVQYIGAQAGHLTQGEIEKLLGQAPENYKVVVI